LAFGNVLAGTTTAAAMTITNTGTGVLTVSGMSGPSGFNASWTSGTIAAGGSQAVTIGFAPTAAGMYGGTITVSGDQTSGSNTITASGSAFPNLNGAWNGTQTASGVGISAICNMSWILSGQTAGQFGGTWQTSGSGCGQAGNLTGTTSITGGVTSLSLSATVNPSPCTRVSGDGLFGGTISSTNVMTVQETETVRCPGVADFARSVTLSMSKQ
jgi:hypothetical protein